MTGKDKKNKRGGGGNAGNGGVSKKSKSIDDANDFLPDASNVEHVAENQRDDITKSLPDKSAVEGAFNIFKGMQTKIDILEGELNELKPKFAAMEKQRDTDAATIKKLEGELNELKPKVEELNELKPKVDELMKKINEMDQKSKVKICDECKTEHENDEKTPFLSPECIKQRTKKYSEDFKKYMAENMVATIMTNVLEKSESDAFKSFVERFPTPPPNETET